MRSLSLNACVALCIGQLVQANAAEPPDFERQIAPLLVAHCLDCHQPSKRSGELDLSTAAGLLKGGEQGSAIVLGKSAESLLVERIAAGEMPPPDTKEAKPLSQAEIETLRAWIAAGAPWPKERQLGIHERPVDLEKAREFWSFQPVQRPSLPPIRDPQSAIRNPVDAFILEKLTAANLALSQPAARADLLRRLSLDLRGLPPSLDEQQTFLADNSPDAYERLVDRMLADPAYGERWARHWLDLVRYADSNGYERDGPKPSVWRYRDYVIAALNSDKPYDRFVIEQLAGDELPDATHETLIATGFHALGTWQDEVDPLEAPQYRADELDDMIRTTSQTFLGLTLGCARCHNHKFDPLTMVDYYSLAAILAPLKRPNEGRDRSRPAARHARADRRRSPAQRGARRVGAEDQRAAEGRSRPTLEQQVAALRDAAARAAAERRPTCRAAYRCFEDSARTLRRRYLLLSGRASNPGPLMQPRVPAVLATVNRRVQRRCRTQCKHRSARYRPALTFAHWLASADNPLTARVIVNRVWQHHFGEGLVATPSDFGQMGARPTHPELLDWLADWFVHDADWSLKKLHRLIVTSETYRQSSSSCRDCRSLAASIPKTSCSGTSPTAGSMSRRFAIRCSPSAGNLNGQMYGPAVFLPIPAGGDRGPHRQAGGLEGVDRAGHRPPHGLRLREADAARADAGNARLLRHDQQHRAAGDHQHRPAGPHALQRRLRQPPGGALRRRDCRAKPATIPPGRSTSPSAWPSAASRPPTNRVAMQQFLEPRSGRH